MPNDAKVVDVVDTCKMECTGFHIFNSSEKTTFLEYKLARHKRVLDNVSQDGKIRYKGCDVTVFGINYGGKFGKTLSFEEYARLGMPKRIVHRRLNEYTACE